MFLNNLKSNAGTAVLLSLLVLFITNGASADSAGNFNAEAFSEAKKANKKIALQFHAPWCPTCRVQQASLAALKKEPKYNSVLFLQAEYDSEKALKEKLGVKGQSAIILFQGEKEVSRSQGVTGKAELSAQLDRLISEK